MQNFNNYQNYNGFQNNYDTLNNNYQTLGQNYNYENVENLNPIVNQSYNYVDRYYLINQPYINECITVYRNHYIKQNTCETKNYVVNCTDYQEVCL